MPFRFLQLSILLITFLFWGCDNDNIAKIKELNKNNPNIPHKTVKLESQTSKERMLKIENQNKIAMQELTAKSQKELAELNAKHQEKLKALEVQKATNEATQLTKQKAIEANKTITLAQIKQKTVISSKAKEISLYKIVALLVLILLIIWLILRYINQHAKRKHEAYIKEQEFHFEAYKHENELKHKNINKMLEIISSDKSDPSVKKEITKILSHNKNYLLQHKKQ